MRNRAILYRFFDRHDRLLYVGITVVGPVRWGQHAIDQRWWPLVASVKVEHFPSIEDAEIAERLAIQTENPTYNRAFQTDGPARLKKPRRPSGTGSVYQVSDGRWTAQVSTGQRGARRIFRKNVATRLLAEQALAEMLTRLAAGQIPRERQRAPKVAA